MKKAKETAMASGKDSISSNQLEMFDKQYDEIIKTAYAENPLPETTEKKRGRKKKSKVLNLIGRRDKYKASTKVSGCFRSMEGIQPEVHGIKAYVKPVIATDTIFDAMIRAGKKCAIVSTARDSLSKIFLEREMDYYIYETVEEVDAKAAELIIEDKYDFMVVYNKDYDSKMHKFGPEGIEALAELRSNSEDFAMFDVMIQRYWKEHNVLVGFAMDHGCHEIDGGAGSHGLDMPEDLNIVHFYKAYAERF